MAWTPNEDHTKISSGPYLVGVGASGSEQSVGDLIGLELALGYERTPIHGGSIHGPDTVVDHIVRGVIAFATFQLVQFDTTTLNRVMPLSTLSTGPTNKKLDLVVTSIAGKSMLASASRIRLHKYSVASLTDEYSDIIFPSGVIVPTADPYSIDGTEEGNRQPCEITAYPGDTDDILITLSKDQT